MSKSQDLFNTDIPNALAKNPDKAKEIGAIYCFKLTGDGGGTWTVDLVASPPSCTAGENGAAQCTIEVAASDFEQLLANPAMGMQLFFSGKLKVSGDPTLAMKFQKLFSMG